MRRSATLILMLVVSTLILVDRAAAQTQETATRTVNFEIVSVNGNTIVYKDQTGATKEYVAKPDAKFTMDGKEMGLADLKPGMKGTATVTTTTTIHPVTVTKIENATVLDVVPGNSIFVRMADGQIRRFTMEDVQKRNAKLYKDGQQVELTQFRPNDRLTATIVTDAPPKIVTEQQVSAMVKGQPAPKPAAAPAPAAAPPPAPAAAPAAAPAPAHKTLPKTASSVPLYGVAGTVLVAVGLMLTLRRKGLNR
jgi:LPXTG-motif cell wall-anchored protein